MKNTKKWSYLLILLSILWIAGCAMPKHYAQPNPNNPIRVVAVLPMVNNTNDVEAPEKVRDMFGAKIPERCYIVKPLQETNQLLKDELGITLGSQLDMTNPKELGIKLGVDAVIYGTLFNFEEKTTGVLNIRRVRAGFKLVDAKTGAVVWGRGQGIKSETRMTEGIAGTIAGGASAVSKLTEDKGGKGAEDYFGLQNWHDLPPEKAMSEQLGQGGFIAGFVSGLAEKTVKKATGTFLKHESETMVGMIIDTLPAGPGSGLCGGTQVAVLPPFMPAIPEPKMPEFSMPAYFELGKRDFTADMITTSTIKSNKETMVFDAKLAKLGDKFRSEMDMGKALKAKGGEMPPGLSRMVFITRPDLKVGYNLYPDKNKYLEIAIKEEKGDIPKIEKNKIGVDTIDGHPCDKFQVKITYKDGAVDEGYLWEAKDLDRFVIRAEMENKDAKTVVEMKNIKLVSPPKALFEAPQGYKKMSGMMELFMEEHP
ncbi:MAG: GNA1162 family protein [Deltaproteobacteria bacterium]